MRIVRYRFANGWRACLVVEQGKKWIKIVPYFPPLKVRRVALTESRYFKDELLHGKPYPVSRAKEIFKRSARGTYGSLRSAPKTIRKALS
jgi:hypothetical protein